MGVMAVITKLDTGRNRMERTKRGIYRSSDNCFSKLSLDIDGSPRRSMACITSLALGGLPQNTVYPGTVSGVALPAHFGICSIVAVRVIKNTGCCCKIIIEKIACH
jgi:hypothetical protein